MFRILVDQGINFLQLDRTQAALDLVDLVVDTNFLWFRFFRLYTRLLGVGSG